MSGKIVSIAVESDEWDEFEGAPSDPPKDVLPGAAWKQAREDVRAANEALAVAEKAVRELLPIDPAPGTTKVARLDHRVCGVLKVHTKLAWDSEVLLRLLASDVLEFGEANDHGIKISFAKSSWERMDDDLKERLLPAHTVTPYERLTYVEFNDDDEVDEFLEHEDV